MLNSPYDYPLRHWELDDQGQPTQQIIERRRPVRFITPIPKPKKRKSSADQHEIAFKDREGLSTTQQQYDLTSIIDELRRHVDEWRKLPNSRDWLVTPVTARLLQHWRHHKFSNWVTKYISPGEPSIAQNGFRGRNPWGEWGRRDQCGHGRCAR
ncbi:MAG: hypothetical protein ACLQAT_00705, partial [Candidatus Binataceae bacterium]